MVRAILLAAIFLMVAAMSLVTARYQARDLFIKNEQLVSQKKELNVVWRHLQLERAELSRNARVDQIARDTLKMTPIAPARTIYIRESSPASSGGLVLMRRLSFLDNPVTHVSFPTWRARLVLLVLGTAFLVLLGRAVYLQSVNRDFLQEQGGKRYESTVTLAATRGQIVDRQGVVLAASIPAKAIWTIPEDTKARHA